MKSLTAFTVVLLVAGITLIGCDDGLLDPGVKARLIVSISGESNAIQKISDESNGFQAVYLAITQIEIKKSGEMWESHDVMIDRVDLVELAEKGLSETLFDDELDAGLYEQIRLHFANSTVLVNDDELDLFVPSGLQTGYKLVEAFELESGVTYEVSIDFNIEQSIVETGDGTYILQPTTRVTVNTQ